MPRKIIGLFLLILTSAAYGQEKWDLKQCVDYALEHNISVRQADLQIRFAKLDYTQSKASQLPSLNFGANTGYSFGRRENPTTGVLEDQNFFSSNFNLQSGVNLFNWFSLKNQIAANKILVQVNSELLKKAQNDVALNVAVAYLQVLLANEQVRIDSVLILQTLNQLDLTRKKINAGVLPELNGAQLDAQLARDSSVLITAWGTRQQYLLQLKALLNLDAAVPFDVQTPPIELIPVEDITALQPEAVYASALQNLPQQAINQLHIEAAQKQAAAARGRMYPSISAFANLGTNYIYFRQPNYAPVLLGFDTTSLRVNNGGTYYVVEAPKVGQGPRIGYITPAPFGSQLNANFGQSVGIGVQVPIFNGRTARTAWDRARLNVASYELLKENDQQNLKRDIYQAYSDALTALQAYNANRKAVETAEKAYSFARKRYDANLLSTFDLLVSQNELARAQIELLRSRYEYVFRIKLLEFYRGQGLKL